VKAELIDDGHSGLSHADVSNYEVL
jgi:hypothetical protein